MFSMHTTILFVVALALGLILVTGPLTSVAPVIQATTEEGDSNGSDNGDEESNNDDSSEGEGGEEQQEEPEPPVVDEQPVEPGTDGVEPVAPAEVVEPVKEPLKCTDGMVLNEQGTKCIAEAEAATAKMLPPCDGSAQDCITPNGDICLVGQGGHECECAEDMSDCPKHPSQLTPPPTKREPLPYCDIMNKDPNWSGSCHDRKDWDEITGLYPCNDGTQKADWKDCADATQKPPFPFPKPPSCKDFPKADECHEYKKKIIVKFIKNVDIVKKISNSDRGNGGDLDIKETIVAINYDEGAGINCVFDDDEHGQCETFDVNKDKGKEPLLQVIDFSKG